MSIICSNQRQILRLWLILKPFSYIVFLSFFICMIKHVSILFYFCQHIKNGIIKLEWHGMICKIKMQGINENPQNASEELWYYALCTEKFISNRVLRSKNVVCTSMIEVISIVEDISLHYNGYMGCIDVKNVSSDWYFQSL